MLQLHMLALRVCGSLPHWPLLKPEGLPDCCSVKYLTLQAEPKSRVTEHLLVYMYSGPLCLALQAVARARGVQHTLEMINSDPPATCSDVVRC